MLYITDNEVAEGFFGGIACLVFLRYFERYFEKTHRSFLLSGIFGWALFWWTRKISMNFYKEFKKKWGISDKTFIIF
jgi:hypothetical protein